jgi:hypothetical protein
VLAIVALLDIENPDLRLTDSMQGPGEMLYPAGNTPSVRVTTLGVIA